jgi:hypothetical protein
MLSRDQSSAQTIVDKDTLRIGQLAASASVGVETLRFYEREGLLERPYQHLSGYRAFWAAGAVMAAFAVLDTIEVSGGSFGLPRRNNSICAGARRRFLIRWPLCFDSEVTSGSHSCPDQLHYAERPSPRHEAVCA